MDWVTAILDVFRSSYIYNYGAGHPELVLVVGTVLYLLLRRNVKAALTLSFAAALCFANYYMFSQQLYFVMPISYAAGFAAISSLVLILLVYQLIQTN